jgi:transcriptional regulator with XRE-family HTH domain
MDSVYVEVGQRLRDARRQQRLSQTYVAEYVGLSRTSITNIERGRQHFPLHVIYQLAEAVGVEPKSLLPDKAGESTLPAELLALPNHLREWALSLRENVEPTALVQDGGNADGST